MKKLITVICIISSSLSTLAWADNSHSSYQQVDNKVGCASKFSDRKKEDLFDNLYNGKYFTWRGKVTIADGKDVGIDLDGGLQDLNVELIDENQSYDLIKGEKITIKFKMYRVGGCFMPFYGNDATILK